MPYWKKSAFQNGVSGAGIFGGGSVLRFCLFVFVVWWLFFVLVICCLFVCLLWQVP